MGNLKATTRFYSYSYTTLGGSHKKRNKPCQDFSSDYTCNDFSIIVVSDGHGSSKHFRSDIGSNLAAKASIEEVKKLIENDFDLANFKENASKIIEDLIGDVYKRWINDISNHMTENPFTEEEIPKDLDKSTKEKFFGTLYPNYYISAYGATLMLGLMAEDFYFAFHIGDGKAVFLYEDGKINQSIPWDDACYINITTSLSDTNAVDNFRYCYGYKTDDEKFVEVGVEKKAKTKKVQGRNNNLLSNEVQCAESIENFPEEKSRKKTKIIKSRLMAIFMGSDGVDDSYRVGDNEESLKNLYRNVYLTLMEKDKMEEAKESIHQVADKFAESGSQDDVSMAGLVRVEKNDELINLFYNQYLEARQAKDLERKKEQLEEKSYHLSQLQDLYDEKNSAYIKNKEALNRVVEDNATKIKEIEESCRNFVKENEKDKAQECKKYNEFLLEISDQIKEKNQEIEKYEQEKDQEVDDSQKTLEIKCYDGEDTLILKVLAGLSKYKRSNVLYISSDEKKYKKNKKAINTYNEKIRKNQETYYSKLEEIDEKESAFLKKSEEKITGLKEEQDNAKEKLSLLMENEAKDIESLKEKINKLKDEIETLKDTSEN